MRALAISLALLFSGVPAVGGPLLPKLKGLTAYGCRVEGPVSFASGDGSPKTGVWQTYTWAEHDKDRDWQMLLSRRSGRKGRQQALADCNEFMAAIEKESRKGGEQHASVSADVHIQIEEARCFGVRYDG
jgi:hypothetical protein